MASILYETDSEPKQIALNSTRNYLIQDIAVVNLKISGTPTVYIRDSNATIDAPAGYHVEKYDLQEIEYAYFGHPTKKTFINEVYIRKNTVVTFQNVEILNLTIEDCEVTISGGKIANTTVLGATLRLRNVDTSALKLHVYKRDMSPQIIVETRWNNASVQPVSIDYFDRDYTTKTFALFRNLNQNECTQLTQIIDDDFHQKKCVKHVDLKGKETQQFKLVMEGMYKVPTPLPEPTTETEKIPETKPPEVNNITMKYCLFNSDYNGCRNAQFAYDSFNLSKIFSFYDPDPVVEVVGDVVFYVNFPATGPITFTGSGSLRGVIQVKPLCTKLVPNIDISNLMLDFFDDGIGTMGYAECKTKPLSFRIVHKERPTTGTFSLNTTVYRGQYVDTVLMDRDTMLLMALEIMSIVIIGMEETNLVTPEKQFQKRDSALVFQMKHQFLKRETVKVLK